MFNFIIVYKLDPPVPKGDLYTEKAWNCMPRLR
jgi:hypothetical protein